MMAHDCLPYRARIGVAVAEDGAIVPIHARYVPGSRPLVAAPWHS